METLKDKNNNVNTAVFMAFFMDIPPCPPQRTSLPEKSVRRRQDFMYLYIKVTYFGPIVNGAEEWMCPVFHLETVFIGIVNAFRKNENAGKPIS